MGVGVGFVDVEGGGRSDDVVLVEEGASIAEAGIRRFERESCVCVGGVVVFAGKDEDLEGKT